MNKGFPDSKRGSLFQTGEMGLIQKIRGWCRHDAIRFLKSKKGRDFRIDVPMGDDAFVAKMTTHPSLAVTTDTLIEGTHFNLKLLSPLLSKNKIWKALGERIAAVNLSDLAAMGNVEPLFAFLTLGLNGDISVDTVDNLYMGIGKFCKIFNFFVAGGDIIRADKSIISLTIVGELPTGYSAISRSGAKEGEILLSSGPLGLSSAGLKILKKQEKSKIPYENILIRSHIYPQPKIREGKLLAGKDILATSLIDTSDDLMTSLEILSGESHVGFEINLENSALHPALLKFSKKEAISPFKFVLYGGEDYQLLFTLPPEKVGLLKKKMPSACILGSVKKKSFGIQIKMNGEPFLMKDCRFKHF